MEFYTRDTLPKNYRVLSEEEKEKWIYPYTDAIRSTLEKSVFTSCMNPENISSLSKLITDFFEYEYHNNRIPYTIVPIINSYVPFCPGIMKTVNIDYATDSTGIQLELSTDSKVKTFFKENFDNLFKDFTTEELFKLHEKIMGELRRRLENINNEE